MKHNNGFRDDKVMKWDSCLQDQEFLFKHEKTVDFKF
jgi:hypothetical protein